MFNQTVLLHLAFFVQSLSKSLAYHKRYIFDENTNDLVTLHSVPYEQRHFQDANDRYITIVGSYRFGFPQLYIIYLLREIIHFKIILAINERDWQKLVLIGLYDMNLVIYSSNLSYQLLHSTLIESHQLFAINTRMIGTPTYFIEVFELYLWIAFLTSFILIGVLSTLGIYLLQRYTSSRFDYLSWYSMYTNQGGDENSRLIFPKILLVSISIIAIIFHGSFGAFLSSYLAIRKPDLPFINLEGLMHIPEYSICSPYGTSSYNYLIDHLKSNEVIAQRVNNKYGPKEFNQIKVILQFGKLNDFCPTDKTVFFAPTRLETTNDNNCSAHRFIALNEKYGTHYNSIMVSPGFKYREQFNRGVIRLRTAEFIQRLEIQLRTYKRNLEHRVGKLEHVPTIDLHQIQIILLIPVAGIALAIIILMIELLIRNY